MDHYIQHIVRRDGCSFSPFPDGSFVRFCLSDGRQRHGTIVYFDTNNLASGKKLFASHHKLQPYPCVTLHGLGRSATGFVLGFGCEDSNSLAIYVPEEPVSLFLVKPATASPTAIPQPQRAAAGPILASKLMSKYVEGQVVRYTAASNGDVSCSATIIKIHDDELVPYYDIRLASGAEKQTDDEHLSTCATTKDTALSNVSPAHLRAYSSARSIAPTTIPEQRHLAAGLTIASKPKSKYSEGQVVVRVTSRNGHVTSPKIYESIDDFLRLASGAEKQKDDNHLSSTTQDTASSNVSSGRGGLDTRNDENVAPNIPALQVQDVTLTSFDYLTMDALKELCEAVGIVSNSAKKKVVVSLLAKRYPDPRPIMKAQALEAFTKPALQKKCGISGISDCGIKTELVGHLKAALSAIQK